MPGPFGPPKKINGFRIARFEIATVSETVVPADAQSQAHQDRSQGGQPFPLRDISDGGSGCAADALSGNPCPNPAAAFFDNTCEAGMMCGTAENRVLEWRATVAVCKYSGKKRVLDVCARPFGGFRRGMLEFSRQI